MRVFLSAGEPSGDVHAAQVIAELRHLQPDTEIAFLGGDCMTQAAQTVPLIHIRRMAYMGFSEVIRHLGDIRSNAAAARQFLRRWKPDAVVLVDYPGFNLPLAGYAHSLGIPTLYYILPKVWAWKSWRVRALRRDCSRLYSILPFEPEWFAERGADVRYVGNPSVREMDAALSRMPDRKAFLSSHGLSDSRPILALVPGSRLGEIRNNLPVMDAVARRHPELQAVIAAAPSVAQEVYRQFSSLPIVAGATLTLMAYSHAALVTSGTATLECAMAGTPQVVCYRANGSRLSFEIMRRVLSVDFVSLPNLIAGRSVIPEMLLHRCTPALVDNALTPLLTDSPARQSQLDGYREIRSRLGSEDPAVTVARSILAL